MKSFLNYTSETFLELSNDEPEELNEISLRTAKPALALAFVFSKSKQVRQKLQNVKSTEDVSEKIDELSGIVKEEIRIEEPEVKKTIREKSKV